MVMERTISNELNKFIGQKVLVKGWIENIRLLGKLAFVIIRDRSGFAQIVVEEKAVLDELKSLNPGTVVEIEGQVAESPQAHNGVEVKMEKISFISKVTEVYPVEVNKPEIQANLDTILDYRPLTLRNRKVNAVFKVQSVIVKAYREFLTKEGFTEFFGPNIIGASSEGGSELFEVKYFDDKALLSQSAQLYKQMMVGVFERVFGLMKCYRAEKSNTRRHLTEATQFEFEMAFIKNHEDVMDMQEKVVKYIVKTVNEECKNEIAILGVEILKAPEDVAFPRVKFHDALQLYFERTGIDERNEIDLSPAAEKELCKYAKEKFGTDFIFIPNFPTKKVAFYAKPNEENPEVANYFDLLAGEVEIASGGQRIHDHDQLVESIKKKGMDPEGFKDYLSIFKFGMPPHGGFGMGMERFTMQLLKLENIREAVLFPSDTKRIASVPIAHKAYFGEEVGNQLLTILKRNNVEFKEIEHAVTKTSEESAQFRGTELKQGVKALILKGKKSKKNIMVNVPADQKLDVKKIAELEGEAFEFESPEVIKERFGLVVGSIPPFGKLLGLKTYMHKGVLENNEIVFNRGSLTNSVLMKSSDLQNIIEAIIFE
jgi:nondiscriminating aspartyl-tRNA synthetase